MMMAELDARTGDEQRDAEGLGHRRWRGGTTRRPSRPSAGCTPTCTARCSPPPAAPSTRWATPQLLDGRWWPAGGVPCWAAAAAPGACHLRWRRVKIPSTTSRRCRPRARWRPTPPSSTRRRDQVARGWLRPARPGKSAERVFEQVRHHATDVENIATTRATQGFIAQAQPPSSATPATPPPSRASPTPPGRGPSGLPGRPGGHRQAVPAAGGVHLGPAPPAEVPGQRLPVYNSMLVKIEQHVGDQRDLPGRRPSRAGEWRCWARPPAGSWTRRRCGRSSTRAEGLHAGGPEALQGEDGGSSSRRSWPGGRPRLPPGPSPTWPRPRPTSRSTERRWATGPKAYELTSGPWPGGTSGAPTRSSSTTWPASSRAPRMATEGERGGGPAQHPGVVRPAGGEEGAGGGQRRLHARIETQMTSARRCGRPSSTRPRASSSAPWPPASRRATPRHLHTYDPARRRKRPGCSRASTCGSAATAGPPPPSTPPALRRLVSPQATRPAGWTSTPGADLRPRGQGGEVRREHHRRPPGQGEEGPGAHQERAAGRRGRPTRPLSGRPTREPCWSGRRPGRRPRRPESRPHLRGPRQAGEEQGRPALHPDAAGPGGFIDINQREPNGKELQELGRGRAQRVGIPKGPVLPRAPLGPPRPALPPGPGAAPVLAQAPQGPRPKTNRQLLEEAPARDPQRPGRLTPSARSWGSQVSDQTPTSTPSWPSRTTSSTAPRPSTPLLACPTTSSTPRLHPLHESRRRSTRGGAPALRRPLPSSRDPGGATTAQLKQAPPSLWKPQAAWVSRLDAASGTRRTTCRRRPSSPRTSSWWPGRPTASRESDGPAQRQGAGAGAEAEPPSAQVDERLDEYLETDLKQTDLQAWARANPDLACILFQHPEWPTPGWWRSRSRSW